MLKHVNRAADTAPLTQVPCSVQRPIVTILLALWIIAGLCLTQFPNIRFQRHLLETGRAQAIPTGKRLESLGPLLGEEHTVGYASDISDEKEAPWRYYQAQFFLAPRRVLDNAESRWIVLDFRDRAALREWCEKHQVECIYDSGDGSGLGVR